MNKKLNEIATIRTGVFLKPSDNGDVAFIQPKYFDEHGVLITSLEPDVNSINISEKHFLVEGDVLYAAKGRKNFAYKISSVKDRCVASTSFFIISVEDDQVLPDFITWFLNQKHVNKMITSMARGSAIRSIPKEVLANLSIPIANRKKQEIIIKLENLKQYKSNAYKRLIELNEVKINANINQILKKETV